MIEVHAIPARQRYRTYIVTGGGQDFVRVYSQQVYGIPPEQVVGTAAGTKYGYDKDGKPFLTKEPKLLLNDNDAGKPEGIHLIIGRRPLAAFGNSTGDRQMLEYPGRRRRAADDAGVARRRAARIRYGPARGLPDTKVGTFTQAALRRGNERRLDRHQHEERLETYLRVRISATSDVQFAPITNGAFSLAICVVPRGIYCGGQSLNFQEVCDAKLRTFSRSCHLRTK